MSVPEQFSLKWNNHTSHLLGVFHSLLQSESLVDVTLSCDGQTIRAHKLVLSACSPYFKTLFEEHTESHPIVILKDVSYSELRSVVQFMYRGEIEVEQTDLDSLFSTAETLMIRGLTGSRLPGNDTEGKTEYNMTANNNKNNANDVSNDNIPGSNPLGSSTSTVSLSTATTTSTTDVSSQLASALAPLSSTAATTAVSSSQPAQESLQQDHQKHSSPKRKRQRRSPSASVTGSTNATTVASEGPNSTADCESELAAVAGTNGIEEVSLASVKMEAEDHEDMNGGTLDTSISELCRSEMVCGDESEAHALRQHLASGDDIDTSVTLSVTQQQQQQQQQQAVNQFLLASQSNSVVSQEAEIQAAMLVNAALNPQSMANLSVAQREVVQHQMHILQEYMRPVLGSMGLPSPAHPSGGVNVISNTLPNSKVGISGLSCNVCAMIMPDSATLEQHLRIHEEEKPYKCAQCGQRYKYQSAYQRHIDMNHTARLPQEKPYKCEVCGQFFKYLKSFHKHRANHSALDRMLTDTAGLTSDSTSGSASVQHPSAPIPPALAATPSFTSEELQLAEQLLRQQQQEQQKEQQQQQHRNKNERKNREAEDSGSDDEPASITITPISALADHTNTPAANSASPTAQQLDTSSVDNHGSPVPVTDETGAMRSWICPYCLKGFKGKENLKLHIRTHTGEKPYECAMCPKRFVGKSDLNRHLRIHTGEKPYQCNICDRRFARCDYLSKHMQTHGSDDSPVSATENPGHDTNESDCDQQDDEMLEQIEEDITSDGKSTTDGGVTDLLNDAEMVASPI